MAATDRTSCTYPRPSPKHRLHCRPCHDHPLQIPSGMLPEDDTNSRQPIWTLGVLRRKMKRSDSSSGFCCAGSLWSASATGPHGRRVCRRSAAYDVRGGCETSRRRGYRTIVSWLERPHLFCVRLFVCVIQLPLLLLYRRPCLSAKRLYQVCLLFQQYGGSV